MNAYMLRHTFVTHLHDSWMDLRNTQKLAGHLNTKTTELCAYISKEILVN
ncbi:tyrosine-type recombinase/integrase [Carboxylicivirga sp. RSCT41]